MVYTAGKADHKLDNERMVEHIVGLVEQRAYQIEAENAAASLLPPTIAPSSRG